MVENTEISSSESSELTDVEMKIITQVEYYFGDANLPRDKFLNAEIKKDDGWVALSTLLTFNRLKSLTTDSAILADSLRKATSGLIEVDEAGEKLRRNPERALPSDDRTRRDDLRLRFVYVKGFPRETTLDQMLEFFDKFGPNEQIQMRKDEKKHFKGSVFVLFTKPETASKFLEATDTCYEEGTELVRMLKDDFFKMKQKERKDKVEETSKKRQQLLKQKEDDDEHKLLDRITKGAILHLTNIVDDTTREQIKAVFEPHVNIAWVDFDKGDKEAKIRFDKEGGASEGWTKAKEAGDGKVLVNGSELEGRVLQDTEEVDHWKFVFQEQRNRREQARNARRGGGRGGGGHRGHRGRGGGHRGARRGASGDRAQGKKTTFDEDDMDNESTENTTEVQKTPVDGSGDNLVTSTEVTKIDEQSTEQAQKRACNEDKDTSADEPVTKKTKVDTTDVTTEQT